MRGGEEGRQLPESRVSTLSWPNSFASNLPNRNADCVSGFSRRSGVATPSHPREGAFADLQPPSEGEKKSRTIDNAGLSTSDHYSLHSTIRMQRRK